MTTVLITGARGFIARHLGRTLSAAGHRVIGTSRLGTAGEEFARVHRAALGESITDLLASEEVGAVIHTANATGAGEYDRNLRGTKQWFDEARAAGAGLQILLSSLSASADAASDYGKAKHALEGVFSEYGQISLRLGIVVGDGGMFERIRNAVGAGRLVPLLDNGKARVHLLGIDFLCAVVAELIATDGEGRRGRAWSIQQPEAVTLRQLMAAIRKQYGFRCAFLPLPSLPILWALSVAERLPLRLPIGTTNIKGLRQSRHASHASHFDSFGHASLSLEALVARAHELENA